MPYKTESGKYALDWRQAGFRIKRSTGTTNKKRAEAIEATLDGLWSSGRRDLLGLLESKRITLVELHEAYQGRGDELELLRDRTDSPVLGALVDEWLDWMRSPAGISPRTKRRYSTSTVTRYEVSWDGFFSVLNKGRNARLCDLTDGFIADYRKSRSLYSGIRDPRGRQPSAATVNRDLVALQSFMTWAEEANGLSFKRPRIRKETEPEGRTRWLSVHELAAFERECVPEWWPFFAVLFYTGARLGEAQGLYGADVLLHAKRLTIHEGKRRVKSRRSVRDLPISEPLESALAEHFARLKVGPADLVFPGCQDYNDVRREWHRACKAAGITGARIHDARHTFGVHAAQAGIPIVRLQKLMGHGTPIMTLRYMAHAPEAYMNQDAAAIAANMTGAVDREAEARAHAARRRMKTA
jgi:integrase